MSELQVGPSTPFLIVSDIERSLAHYVGELGFTCTYKNSQPDDDLYFAIVNRGSAQVMLKVITEAIKPMPNHTRHEWAPWDVFIYTSEPDELAREFSEKQVVFHRPLRDAEEDGLRGFEIADPDGYVVYFGRPIQKPTQN